MGASGDSTGGLREDPRRSPSLVQAEAFARGRLLTPRFSLPLCSLQAYCSRGIPEPAVLCRRGVSGTQGLGANFEGGAHRESGELS